jgi:hypothetical protein
MNLLLLNIKNPTKKTRYLIFTLNESKIVYSGEFCSINREESYLTQNNERISFYYFEKIYNVSNNERLMWNYSLSFDTRVILKIYIFKNLPSAINKYINEFM